MMHPVPFLRASALFVLALPPAGLAADLAVNEILAINYAYEAKGTVTDLVEIVNMGADPIALGGAGDPIYLTNDPYGDPRRWWAFPAGTVIPAGGYLTIACGFVGAGGLRAPFTLDDTGGTIAIIAGTERRILDLVRYPVQYDNIAYARFEEADNSHLWRYTRKPTFFFDGAAVCARQWGDPLPMWSLFCEPLDVPCPLAPGNVVDEGFIPDIDAVDYAGPFIPRTDGPALPRATDEVVVTGRLPIGPAFVDVDLHYLPVSPAGAEGEEVAVPMQDDGSGEGLWSGTVPPHPAGTTIRFWLTSRWKDAESPEACRDREPRIDHDPPYNLYTVENRGPGGIRINEVLILNDRVNWTREGYSDPWIEIYNPSDEEVDVAGLYLTRNPRQPFNWRFPDGEKDLTTIPAKEHILVWVSGRWKPPGYPELHSRIRSVESSRIYIANEKGVFDGIDWSEDPRPAGACGIRDDEQDPDVSIGRIPDGSDTIARILKPTPAAPNPEGPAPVIRDIRPAPGAASCAIPCAASSLIAAGEGFDPLPRVFIDESPNPWAPDRKEVLGIEALPDGSLRIPLGGTCRTEGRFALWIQRHSPSGAVAAKAVVRCSPQITGIEVEAGRMILDICGSGRIASVAVDGTPIAFSVDPPPDARPRQVSIRAPECGDRGRIIAIVDEEGWEASVTLPRCGRFIRGDVTGDGRFDLGDAIAGLSYLFAGAGAGCADAVDFDDDGRLLIGDPIALLNYLFASGPPPADPFPGCGSDAGVDVISCGSSPACP